MGVFQEHGRYATYETAEAGAYTCALVNVEKTEGPSFENKDIIEAQFKWTFEAADGTMDSEGLPFRFTKFTKTAYGNEKANLTILLNGMVGRSLTPEEFGSLDVSQLQRTHYLVMVTLVPNSKNELVNKIQAVSRVRQQPASNGGQAQQPRQQAPQPGGQRPQPPANASVVNQVGPSPNGNQQRQWTNTAPTPSGGGDDFDDLTDPFAE